MLAVILASMYLQEAIDVLMPKVKQFRPECFEFLISLSASEAPSVYH